MHTANVLDENHGVDGSNIHTCSRNLRACMGRSAKLHATND